MAITTLTETPITEITGGAGETARAVQEINALLVEIELDAARISDPEVRAAVNQQIGLVRGQISQGGVRPDMVGALKQNLQQLATTAKDAAATSTANTSAAVMNDIMLSAAAEERIHIRSQVIDRSNIHAFTNSFLDDVDLDPAAKTRVADTAAKILIDSPELAELNAMPAPVREKAYRTAEEGKAKVDAMLKDPRYAAYSKTLGAFQRFDLTSSPEGLSLLERIEKGEVTPEEARSEGRAMVGAKGRRADRHDREIAKGLEPDAKRELEAAGLAKGDDLDMEAIFKARDELPGDWNKRASAYYGKPLSEWPAEMRREAAIREAAQTGVLVTSVEDIMRIGRGIERAHQANLSADERAQLEQAGALYATMTDKTADLTTRYAAVDAYLQENNPSYAGARDWVKTNTVQRILAGIDENPDLYRGQASRAEIAAHMDTLQGLGKEVLANYKVALDEQAKATAHASVDAMKHTISEFRARLNQSPAVQIDTMIKDLQATNAPVSSGNPAPVVPTEAKPEELATQPPAAPKVSVGMTDPADKRAEGSQGTWDNLYENAVEKQIKSAISGLETPVLVSTLAPLLGEYNVGDKDYVSVHEIENALAAAGFTRPEQIGNGDKVLTLDEIVAALTPKTPADSGPQNGRS